MNFYNAQALCGVNDVVVVAINYRLNIFGFLTTGKDTNYPGNMGMLDQVLALKWTRDNIRNFGGNPDNVTMFGQSAGGFAVSAHMFSPMSKRLFHKAIHHSGTAGMPGLIKLDYSHILKIYKDELKITESDPDKIVKKLKFLPSEDLLKIVEDTIKEMAYFSVTVDGRFLLDHPDNLLEKGEILSIPSIVGFNNTETSGALTEFSHPSFFEGYTEEDIDTYFKPFFAFFHSEKGEQKLNKLYEEMKSHYIKQFPKEDKLKWTKVSATAQSDFMFAVPSIKQALISSKNGNPTYLYYMTQQLKYNHFDEYAVELKKKADFCECDHGDDIIFTFGAPFMNGKKLKECKFSANEEHLSRDWMTYIANFATSGNPNIGKNVSLQWPAYVGETKRHLNVQIPLTEGSNLKKEDYKFWNETAA